MANFWDYESAESNRARAATAWTEQAKKDSWDWLANQNQQAQGLPPEALKPVDPGNVLADKPDWSWTPDDSASIVKPVGKSSDSVNSGGFLSDVGGLIKSAAESVALGPINKPWDILRPVQRALEAEQQYVARPLSKIALSPFGDYDTMPEIVKLGAQVVFDPLTYIGPGAISDAFKIARLAPELKLAAPSLETLFTSPGSRRAFSHVIEQAGMGLASVGGAEAAQALGLPSVLGGLSGPVALGRLRGSSVRSVVNPDDVAFGDSAATGETTGMYAMPKPGELPPPPARPSTVLETQAKGWSNTELTQQIEKTKQDLSDASSVGYSTSSYEKDLKELVGIQQMRDQPDLQKALKSDDDAMDALMNRPKQQRAELQTQVDASTALSNTPRGLEILAKKTRGEPLTGRDYQDMGDIINKYKNLPQCSES